LLPVAVEPTIPNFTDHPTVWFSDIRRLGVRMHHRRKISSDISLRFFLLIYRVLSVRLPHVAIELRKRCISQLINHMHRSRILDIDVSPPALLLGRMLDTLAVPALFT
jgi:hypothetical protein